jgi:choline dehydrogenase-like flavoprotein
LILDSTTLPTDTVLSADVAVVGAGPAGIVTALELADDGFDVVLMESGGRNFKPEVQRLAEAAALDPRRHAPMWLATRRQVGGTSVIWGGRCVPYDPVDFESRDLVPDGRWPVGYAELAPFFQRACDWFVCGRAAFDGRELSHLPPSLVPGLSDDDVRTSTFERWSLPTDFGREYRRRLRASTRLRLLTGVTCTQVACAPGEQRVDHLEGRTLDGRRILVRAQRYILACGGLETTRLLMVSPRPQGVAMGDHSGHLGRWYMGHLEGVIARARFSTPPHETIFGYERDVDGVWVRRRMSFTAETQRRLGLPNIVSWLANRPLSDPVHRSGALSMAYLALTSPFGCLFAPEAQRLTLTGHAVAGAPYWAAYRGPIREHVRNVFRDARTAAAFVAEIGGGRVLPRRRRVPGFFVYSPTNTYDLQFHGEHLPNRDSRVTLSNARDEVGMPRLNIDIRFSDEDVAGVIRAHRYWDEYLRRHQVGHLEYLTPDVATAVRENIGGGFHQVGTTRMSERPEDGVLTPDLAVHGFHDLFVVSSSAFVTSSQANSTFMIVVMALRLADRLRAELRGYASFTSPTLAGVLATN